MDKQFVIAKVCEHLLFGPYLAYLKDAGSPATESNMADAAHYTLEDAMEETKNLNKRGTGHYKVVRDTNVKGVYNG